MFSLWGFITKILAHFGISFVNEDVVQISDNIDKYILLQSKLKVNSDGILCWDVENFPTQCSIPTTSTPTSPNSSPIHNSTLPESSDLNPPSNIQLSTLYQLVQDMGSRFDSALQSVSKQIQELNEKVDYVSDRMEVLVSHHNDYVVKIQEFDKLEAVTDEAA